MILASLLTPARATIILAPVVGLGVALLVTSVDVGAASAIVVLVCGVVAELASRRRTSRMPGESLSDIVARRGSSLGKQEAVRTKGVAAVRSLSRLSEDKTIMSIGDRHV